MQTAGQENVWSRVTLLLSGGSAVAIIFSIAAAQVLLGAALVALILSKTSLRFPPVKLPLAIFVAWTLLAVAASPDPMGGWPQVRKLILFAVLLVVFSGVRNALQARWLLMAIAAASVLSSLWSFVQFSRKLAEARAEHSAFYDYYLGNRTTGFMSHWMTFSGEMVMAVAILLSFVLFASRPARERWWAAGACLLIGVALALNQTRGAWIAAGAAAGYLIACWRPKWLLAIPVLAVIAWVAAPDAVHQRAVSIFQPHGRQDSNQHRMIVWRTGLAMIQAHPLLGLGPERIGKEFTAYMPADISRPLPEGYYAHVHNVYLQYAAERGLPALFAMLWLLIKMALDWLRALRRGGDRFLLQAALAALLGTAISGLTEYNLGNSEVLHLFLAMAACAYVGVTCKLPSTAAQPHLSSAR